MLRRLDTCDVAEKLSGVVFNYLHRPSAHILLQYINRSNNMYFEYL